jgi:hypothetical protein
MATTSPARKSPTARLIASGVAAAMLLTCPARVVSGVMVEAGMEQFESFKASQLYCRKCAKSMPVRERLLLILPDKELYEYLCTGCAASLGEREVSLAEKRLASLRGQRRRS